MKLNTFDFSQEQHINTAGDGHPNGNEDSDKENGATLSDLTDAEEQIRSLEAKNEKLEAALRVASAGSGSAPGAEQEELLRENIERQQEIMVLQEKVHAFECNGSAEVMAKEDLVKNNEALEEERYSLEMKLAALVTRENEQKKLEHALRDEIEDLKGQLSVSSSGNAESGAQIQQLSTQMKQYQQEIMTLTSKLEEAEVHSKDNERKALQNATQRAQMAEKMEKAMQLANILI